MMLKQSESESIRQKEMAGTLPNNELRLSELEDELNKTQSNNHNLRDSISKCDQIMNNLKRRESTIKISSSQVNPMALSQRLIIENVDEGEDMLAGISSDEEEKEKVKEEVSTLRPPRNKFDNTTVPQLKVGQISVAKMNIESEVTSRI